MTFDPALAQSELPARRIQLGLYRRMTATEKMRCVRDVSNSANALALAGLRTRHPSATERELLLRLAVLRLGEESVFRAYGWRPGHAS